MIQSSVRRPSRLMTTNACRKHATAAKRHADAIKKRQPARDHHVGRRRQGRDGHRGRSPQGRGGHGRGQAQGGLRHHRKCRHEVRFCINNFRAWWFRFASFRPRSCCCAGHTHNPFPRIPCSVLMHDSYQPTNVNSRCISMHLVSTAIDHKQARLPWQPQPQRHQQRRGENFQRTHHRRRRRPRPRRPGRPEARLLLRLPQGRREPGREGPGRGLRLADQRNVRTYDRHYQRMTSQPPLSLFLGSVGDDVYKFIVVDYCSSPNKRNMCSGRNPSLRSTVCSSVLRIVFFFAFSSSSGRRRGRLRSEDSFIHSSGPPWFASRDIEIFLREEPMG